VPNITSRVVLCSKLVFCTVGTAHKTIIDLVISILLVCYYRLISIDITHAREAEIAKKFTDGKEIKNVIVVPGKLVNFIIG
jgi:leucyl-tRNA synthetase